LEKCGEISRNGVHKLHVNWSCDDYSVEEIGIYIFISQQQSTGNASAPALLLLVHSYFHLPFVKKRKVMKPRGKTIITMVNVQVAMIEFLNDWGCAEE